MRHAEWFWSLWLIILVACCLWCLAYQVPFRQTVLVGGDQHFHRRSDDAVFLDGVHGSEPADEVLDRDNPACQLQPIPANVRCKLWWWEWLAQKGQRPYRWTQAATSFLVPGVGGGRYSLELLAGGRPGGAATVWQTGPGLRYELTLPEGEPRRYWLLAATEPTGDLRVTMRTTPFLPPNDPRELGFRLYELRVAPVEPAPYAPAWSQLSWLMLALAGVYIAARAATAPVWGAGALTLLGALGGAYALASARPALTVFTPTLAILAWICATVSLGGLWLSGWLTRRGRLNVNIAPVVGLVVAAFALRMAGMLHPHAIYSDSGLQSHKLYEAMLGNVFLTAGLPSDAGGGQAPYPPGPFLTMLPLGLAFPNEDSARVLLVQAGSALLDSLTIASLWLIMRRVGLGQRSALLAGAYYLLPVSALESFGIGELANLGGQALAMPFLTLLALGYAAPVPQPPPLSTNRWPLLALTVALSVGLLAHSGVTLSLGALVATAWGIAIVQTLVLRRAGPFSFWRLSIAAGVALTLVVLIYYSAPVYVTGRLGQSAGEPRAGMPPGQILTETARALVGLIPPQRRGIALPTLLGLTALGGLAALWAARGAWLRTAALRALLAAWWGGTLLTQALLLVADQGVRWAIFLYPGLCLSAGTLLGAFWRRGRAGRVVAGLVLGALLAYGLRVWIVHVRDYYH